MLFTDLPWELAALLGAVLGPDRRRPECRRRLRFFTPASIRRALNVESGLNDGIATPVVTALIAAAAVAIGVGALEDTASTHGTGALVDLVGGLAIGAIVGYLGGLGVTRARLRRWIPPGGAASSPSCSPSWRSPSPRRPGSTTSWPPSSPASPSAPVLGRDDEEVTELPELIGQVLALAVWFVFGAGLLSTGWNSSTGGSPCTRC